MPSAVLVGRVEDGGGECSTGTVPSSDTVFMFTENSSVGIIVHRDIRNLENA